MKKHLSTTILSLVFLVGLSLLLYPTISDYLNSLHQSRAISGYVARVADLDEEEYETMWNEAQTYNDALQEQPAHYRLSKAEATRYLQTLDPEESGLMGYIEIPDIHLSLPICHGTEERTLQTAIGHLEWSSLPVGGEGHHCVLSGHRGLPSAKLFTDLDQLTTGDTFILRVLNEALTYEVDQILIVAPQETDALQIAAGQDYCTLMTCTPYGVNTHRLLVRGHRVENAGETMEAYVTADAIQIKPVLVAAMLSVPVLALLLIALLIPKRNKEGDT